MLRIWCLRHGARHAGEIRRRIRRRIHRGRRLRANAVHDPDPFGVLPGTWTFRAGTPDSRMDRAWFCGMGCRFRNVRICRSGSMRGLTASLIRLAARSSTSSGFSTPRTCALRSSTPMRIVPPVVLANATTVRRTRAGEDKSRLNSKSFPSGRRSISARSIARKSTLKRRSRPSFRAPCGAEGQPFSTLHESAMSVIASMNACSSRSPALSATALDSWRAITRKPGPCHRCRSPA